MSPKSGGRAQRRLRRNLGSASSSWWRSALGSFAAVFAAKWSPRLGLDLAGGVSVVYTAEGQHVSQADLDETVNILNLRVNGLGVSGAQVQTTGKNQISVSIPGVTDAQQVLDQIGQTARMYFRPVECFAYPQARPEGRRRPRRCHEASGRFPPVSASSQLTAANLAVTPNNSPPGLPSNNVPPGQPVRGLPVDERRQARLRHQHRAAARAQRRLRRCRGPLRARPAPDDGPFHRQRPGHAEPDRAWVVDYTLAGAAGSALWDKVAQENFHQLLGIELDGAGYSAPIIQPTPGELLVLRRQGRDLRGT